MVMYSREPWCSTTVSWITWRVVKPEAVSWMRSPFSTVALWPSRASVALRIGCSAARLARLIELTMPLPSDMFIEA